MYTEEEIMKLLREGASSDDLAQSFADMLNSAIDRLDAEEEERKAREAAEKAKREEELRLKKKKTEDANAVIAHMQNYAKLYHGAKIDINEEALDLMCGGSEKLVNEFVDAIGELLKCW